MKQLRTVAKCLVVAGFLTTANLAHAGVGDHMFGDWNSVTSLSLADGVTATISRTSTGNATPGIGAVTGTNYPSNFYTPSPTGGVTEMYSDAKLSSGSNIIYTVNFSSPVTAPRFHLM